MKNRVVFWTVVIASLGAVAAFGVDLLHDHRLASKLYSEMKQNDPVVVERIIVPARPSQADPLADHGGPSGLLILASAIKTVAATETTADISTDATGEMLPAAEPTLSLEEIVVKLTEQGYTEILEVEWEHGRYEAKATDAGGEAVEVHIDPVTGEVMSQKQPKAPKVKAPKAKQSTLKFKVTPEFRREFKDFAKSEGVTVKELMEEGFRLVKERRGM